MFDGDIVCISQHGHGSNFVFIVAVSDDRGEIDNGISSDRILNPLSKEYEKIEVIQSNIPKKQTIIPQMFS